MAVYYQRKSKGQIALETMRDILGLVAKSKEAQKLQEMDTFYNLFQIERAKGRIPFGESAAEVNKMAELLGVPIPTAPQAGPTQEGAPPLSPIPLLPSIQKPKQLGGGKLFFGLPPTEEQKTRKELSFFQKIGAEEGIPREEVTRGFLGIKKEKPEKEQIPDFREGRTKELMSQGFAPEIAAQQAEKEYQDLLVQKSKDIAGGKPTKDQSLSIVNTAIDNVRAEMSQIQGRFGIYGDLGIKQPNDPEVTQAKARLDTLRTNLTDLTKQFSDISSGVIKKPIGTKTAIQQTLTLSPIEQQVADALKKEYTDKGIGINWDLVKQKNPKLNTDKIRQYFGQ